MRTALAIIQRDLNERRFIFIAAIVFSIIPFIALLLFPGIRRNSQEFVAIFALAQIFWFPVALALGLGSTMIGSDLTAGRLSFYFSKPISPRSLWYGKLLAALITIYISMAIVGMPGTIYTWSYRLNQWLDRGSVLLAAVIVVPVVLLLGHVLSTMIRSRSAWVALDAVGVAVAAPATYWILKPIFDGGATRLFIAVSCSIFGAATLVLIVSGAWHLSHARTDRRANHLELSKMLWTSLALILVVAGAAVAWIIHAAPTRLKDMSLYSAPTGPWIVAGGIAPHRLDYRSAFLVNMETGRFLRHELESGVIAFSRDGRHVAWTHNTAPGHGPLEVWTRSLDPLTEVRRTGIETTSRVQLVMSDDGRRVAYVDGGILNVADAATGRSIASAHVASSGRWETWMYFAEPDRVRFIVNTAAPEAQMNVPRLHSLTISEFDVRTRRFTQTGAVNIVARSMWVATTNDGANLLVHAFKPAEPADSFFVADARTGARVTSLPGGEVNSYAPLPNGSSVSLVLSKDGWVVRSHPLSGSPFHDINIGSATWARIAAANGDRVLVALEDHDHGDDLSAGWHAVLVNLSAGSILRNIPNLRVSTPQHMYEDDPRLFVPSGPLVAGVDSNGYLVRVDMNQGAVTPLPQ